MPNQPIYHIAITDEWQAAQDGGVYTPGPFAEEGFIHCSYLHQILGAANNYFSGRTDLVLLKLDRNRLVYEVIDENLFGGEMLFPHHYGPLTVEAVAQVFPFSCDEDGGFSQLPEGLG